MAISSADDLRGERHADDPVIPDMPRRVMRAPGSSFPLFGTQVTYPRTARHSSANRDAKPEYPSQLP